MVLGFDDADRVLALLRDLAGLAPRPQHIVLVDNGSRDGTPDRVEAAFPHVQVVRLGCNAGFAAAANVGIRRALASGSTAVWLLNSDLELPPDALGQLAAALEGPCVGMAAPVLVEDDGAVQAWGGGCVDLRNGMVRHLRGSARIVPRLVQRLAPRRGPHDARRRDRHDVAHGPDYLSGACLLLKAGMLQQVGLLDERYFFYFEDVDLGVRARAAGWQLAVVPACRVVHQEAASLGAWSRERWRLLFAGLALLLARYSPAPRLAYARRLAGHTATMLGHGRWQAAAGAWRAPWPGREPRERKVQAAR